MKTILKEYSVIGSAHGAIVNAKSMREAKKIFRRFYRSERIIFCGLAGKIKLKKIC